MHPFEKPSLTDYALVLSLQIYRKISIKGFRMAYIWSTTYINTVLIPALNQIVFQTELGGNSSVIGTFSYAGGSQSSSSFGLYQYDVDNNAAARTLLSQFGFTAAQIQTLRAHAPLSATDSRNLSNQLTSALQNQTNLQALQNFDNTWAASLITNLSASLTRVAAASSTGAAIASQIYQNESLQLALLDYGNQFHIDPNGQVERFLEGFAVNLPGGTQQLAPGATLTVAMLQNFAMHTQYGHEYPTPLANRQNRFNTGWSNVSSGGVGVSPEGTSNPTSPPVLITVVGDASTQTTVSVTVTYPDGTPMATPAGLNDAANQAINGQSVSDGTPDGTDQSSTLPDGGMLPELPDPDPDGGGLIIEPAIAKSPMHTTGGTSSVIAAASNSVRNPGESTSSLVSAPISATGLVQAMAAFNTVPGMVNMEHQITNQEYLNPILANSSTQRFASR